MGPSRVDHTKGTVAKRLNLPKRGMIRKEQERKRKKGVTTNMLFPEVSFKADLAMHLYVDSVSSFIPDAGSQNNNLVLYSHRVLADIDLSRFGPAIGGGKAFFSRQTRSCVSLRSSRGFSLTITRHHPTSCCYCSLPFAASCSLFFHLLHPSNCLTNFG